jgi:hypothetical protein
VALTSTRTQWEYKLEALNLNPVDIDFDDPDELNGLGAEGWELVSVRPNPTEAAAPFLCIFKRPVHD